MSVLAEPIAARGDARRKLLDASFTVIRAKGYSATTVDDLCSAAGVSKGAFFHHFESKEALGVAAADHWSETTGAFFETAPYHKFADPLDRVLGYIDFRRSILRGAVGDFTCLAGTLLQETYDTHPAIRDAAQRSVFDHAAHVARDVAAAVKARGMKPEWTPKSLALHTQAVLQGAFILAKATGSAAVAIEMVDHLRRYVELLFGDGRKKI
jgi:TetR/AcrR family transcriptional regulator, transcriptional repressor for nem operon